MKQVQIFFTILYFSSLHSFSAISDEYKEVLQRGYAIRGDSVQLPDGQYCLIADFNAGICGGEWKNQDYCIPEGGLVWDEDRCCEGLAPWIAEGVDGHTICKKISKKNSMYLYLIYSLPVLLILFLILRRRGNQIKKQKRKRFESNRSF